MNFEEIFDLITTNEEKIYLIYKKIEKITPSDNKADLWFSAVDIFNTWTDSSINPPDFPCKCDMKFMIHDKGCLWVFQKQNKS